MFLEIVNVSLRFAGLRVLHEICLNVSKGEILGLIGPNGAGKTSLLNVIAGVFPPNAGEVRFEERRVSGLPPEAMCRLGVSRTFQIASSFPRMTALESVAVAAAFGRNPRGAGIPRRAFEMLEFVGFPRPADTLAMDLNTAELKRLDLARALAGRPKLLLLDELFAGLSHQEISALVGLLHEIRREGVAMVVVEHLMRVIMQECSRIVVLRAGEKLAEGTPQEIARNPQVVDTYLGTTGTTVGN